MLLEKSKTKDEITEFFKNHPKREHAFVTFTPEGLREAEKAGWFVYEVPAEEAKTRTPLPYPTAPYGIIAWADRSRGIKKPSVLLFPAGTYPLYHEWAISPDTGNGCVQREEAILRFFNFTGLVPDAAVASALFRFARDVGPLPANTRPIV